MPTDDAPTTSEWTTILLPSKVQLILEVWGYLHQWIWSSLIKIIATDCLLSTIICTDSLNRNLFTPLLMQKLIAIIYALFCFRCHEMSVSRRVSRCTSAPWFSPWCNTYGRSTRTPPRRVKIPTSVWLISSRWDNPDVLLIWVIFFAYE